MAFGSSVKRRFKRLLHAPRRLKAGRDKKRLGRNEVKQVDHDAEVDSAKEVDSSRSGDSKRSSHNIHDDAISVVIPAIARLRREASVSDESCRGSAGEEGKVGPSAQQLPPLATSPLELATTFTTTRPSLPSPESSQEPRQAPPFASAKPLAARSHSQSRKSISAPTSATSLPPPTQHLTSEPPLSLVTTATPKEDEAAYIARGTTPLQYSPEPSTSTSPRLSQSPLIACESPPELILPVVDVPRSLAPAVAAHKSSAVRFDLSDSLSTFSEASDTVVDPDRRRQTERSEGQEETSQLVEVCDSRNQLVPTDSKVVLEEPRRRTIPAFVPPRPPANREMAEQELQSCIRQLQQALTDSDPSAASSVLSQAKVSLLHLNALIPTPQLSTSHLRLARETLELGALVSIRLQDPDSFTRYFQQLQPFYAVDEARLPADGSSESKITGLYLLLLLSQGDYAGFHTLLESLEVAAEQAKEDGKEGRGLDDNPFIQYPVRLEQALMEGGYDRVWGDTKGESVPSPEFGVFSEVLIGTIRSEIASCSERAYPSLPIVNAKNLFFLESEGSVVQFAQQRGWTVKDGRVYFPQQEADLMNSEKDILVTSGQVIENTLGYARELEMIV